MNSNKNDNNNYSPCEIKEDKLSDINSYKDEKFEINPITVDGFILSTPDDSELDMRMDGAIPKQLTTGIPSSPAIHERPGDYAPTHTCRNNSIKACSSTDSLHLDDIDSDYEYYQSNQIMIDPDAIFGIFIFYFFN